MCTPDDLSDGVEFATAVEEFLLSKEGLIPPWQIGGILVAYGVKIIYHTTSTNRQFAEDLTSATNLGLDWARLTDEETD